MLVPTTTTCLCGRSPSAQMALPEPPDMLVRQISICAGNVKVKQDPRFLTMLPYQAQKLPLDYCSSWPIWVSNPGGKVPVTRVPVPEADLEEWWTTWVPPAAFEQLWLPEDLPQPVARPAIGLVLSNGEPRYVFPTLDTTLVSPDGVVWRNRGLHSVPLAKTWLHYGESPPEALRLSAYHAMTAARGDGEAKGAELVGEEETAAAEWRPYLTCLGNWPVQAALDEALQALESLPPLLQKKLGQGFCYLLVPLPESNSLPTETLAPGSRLRFFMSDDLDFDPNDVGGAQGDEATAVDEDSWQRGEIGECDLTVCTVPSGKGSPYLPKPYEPLYQREW
eukprot:scaffold77814_cov67-Phaeocystis_antarctica.AAC.11